MSKKSAFLMKKLENEQMKKKKRIFKQSCLERKRSAKLTVGIAKVAHFSYGSCQSFFKMALRTSGGDIGTRPVLMQLQI